MTNEEAYAKVKERLACDHADRKPVRFVDSAGRLHLRLQCQRCGHCAAGQKNGHDLNRLPPVNQELIDNWHNFERQVWEWHGQITAANRQAEQMERRNAWFTEYNRYLKSSHWAKVRRQVITRDQFTCQVCFRRVTDESAAVHHLSYDTYNQIGQSVPAECVTLCRECHEEIETAKRRIGFVREAAIYGN